MCAAGALSTCVILNSLFFAAFLLTGCRAQPSQPLSDTTRCQRIVSLSPSVTETLYALHLGARIVGVTRFCRYPIEARQKPQVGGYLDPDLEALLRLQPDLVVLRQEQAGVLDKLHRLHIVTLPVEHRSTEGILTSFRQIGQRCGKEQQAHRIAQALEARIQAIQHKTAAATTRPRVLVVVDRDSNPLSASTIRWVYAAGEDGFYSRLLSGAGARNALPEGRRGFLQMSAESILRLDPDIIIEIIPSLGSSHAARVAAQKSWRASPSLSRLKAVRNGRLLLLSQDYLVIPGPRFAQALSHFARIIHPELNWSEPTPGNAPGNTESAGTRHPDSAS